MSEVVEDFTAILAYLDDPDFRWNAFAQTGTSVVVTYRFPQADELPAGPGLYGADTFAGFDKIQREYARQAIAELSKVAGVIMIEVTGDDAMIDLYSGLDSDDSGIFASGYADYGQGRDDGTTDSDLVMIYQDFTPGGFTYQVLLHELGHAMGLSHTHEGEHVLADEIDNNIHSVMTYRPSATKQTAYGDLDKAALAHLYGEADAVADFVAGVAEDGVIVLRASMGADRIIAAATDTLILGLSGADRLYGREGNDTLFGGRGGDALRGGLGDDVIRGQMGADVIYGDGAGGLSDGGDILRGGYGRDRIFGQGGDDLLTGNSAKDRLSGGAGNDELRGGSGADLIIGGEGDDRMSGGIGRDTFVFRPTDYGDRDVITDFAARGDILDLSRLTGVTFDDLAIRQVGADTAIYCDNYDLRILLLNQDKAGLSLHHFNFSEIS